MLQKEISQLLENQNDEWGEGTEEEETEETPDEEKPTEEDEGGEDDSFE